MAESSEGEDDGKITGRSQKLVVDEDLCEMAKTDAWSVSSCKPGNGVSSLHDNNMDSYWQSDGAQPHLVNIQFLKEDILSNSSIDIRLQKKAVFLVADLAEGQIQNRNKPELHSFSNPFFVKSVVDLLASTDLDLQEKALDTVKSLIQLRSIKASILKDLCKLDKALEKMGKRLQLLLTEGDEREYAMDLEVYRREVK